MVPGFGDREGRGQGPAADVQWGDSLRVSVSVSGGRSSRVSASAVRCSGAGAEPVYGTGAGTECETGSESAHITKG